VNVKIDKLIEDLFSEELPDRTKYAVSQRKALQQLRSECLNRGGVFMPGMLEIEQNEGPQEFIGFLKRFQSAPGFSANLIVGAILFDDVDHVAERWIAPRRGTCGPAVDRLLHPLWDGDRSDVATFSSQVSDDPMAFPKLKIL
jgi:hypothetical protein